MAFLKDFQMTLHVRFSSTVDPKDAILIQLAKPIYLWQFLEVAGW
jgi:hypothetical protein